MALLDGYAGAGIVEQNSYQHMMDSTYGCYVGSCSVGNLLLNEGCWIEADGLPDRKVRFDAVSSDHLGGAPLPTSSVLGRDGENLND